MIARTEDTRDCIFGRFYANLCRMGTVFRSKVDGKLKAVGFVMACVSLLASATSPLHTVADF